LRYNKLVNRVLIITDLPEPVWPAINMCGILFSSPTTASPEISLPIAKLNGSWACFHCFECPAVSKFYKNNLQNKMRQQCAMRHIEKKVFEDVYKNYVFDEDQIKRNFTYAENWNTWLRAKVYEKFLFFIQRRSHKNEYGNYRQETTA